VLQDKVVVVSGIGPGLGRAIAVRSALSGADVVLAARTESTLSKVAEEVEATGRRALAVPTDITDEASAQALAKIAVETFGRVDALVNNAYAEPPFDDFVNVELDDIRSSFETTVFAALRLTRLFAPALKSTNGSIVMINSIVVRESKPQFGPYKMGKTALLSLAQTLASELGPQGIRVNTVVPGFIWTDAMKEAFQFQADERGVSLQEVYDEIAADMDLRRLPEPDEVANTVLFLASDLARAVTGQSLDVNGGQFHH
jgi:NAD(P)-dependent dehydrogenase (short-subunit alcohol dehydrogenase family)